MSAPKHQGEQEPAATPTTGHEWDGIRELDNPLPRWWLIVWWISIAFAVVYWVLMPAWPGLHGYTRGLLGRSDRAALVSDMKALTAQRGPMGQKLLKASLAQIEADPELQAYAMAAGQAAFGDNCATCHGAGGGGAAGYPNLRDDVWLWGGGLEDIHRTIETGVRSGHPQARASAMPAFGRDKILTPSQVDDLTDYVLSLSGRRPDKASVLRAQPLFQQNCAACHGPTGAGQQAMGAPNLTDADWLYGSSAQAVRDQIWNGHGGVMPAWKGRFGEDVIKALTVYVHVNAGGR